ncbi:uncharacterized protein LOC135124227 isoform X2 [Zophobas morio]|uniref:uncharacterized protein LOC135124227 isoform X2 n=1 Tax=Zophobas morio TaxID=2755281 RepID=UPI003082CD57
MDEFGLKDDKFVDIHGREVPTRKLGIRQEEVCLLSDLKQTGVGIYQKSQYAKLATVPKNYDSEFLDYMLDAAKSYMLANKISFAEEQIMHSIEHCKAYLSSNKKPQHQVSRQSILNNRIVKTGSDEEILIQVPNTSAPKSPHTPKMKSPLHKSRVTSEQAQRRVHERGTPPQATTSQTRDTLMNGVVLKQARSFSAAEDGQSVPRLRQPSKITYNIIQEEHDVMVTAIDKPNCVWVRDVMNNALLEKIHHKVNEEARYKPAAPKPWVMDKVYMARDENNWFRCRIYRYCPLTAFFLDYGNVAEVNEVREVSEELAKTPCLAVRITFKDNEYKPVVEDVIRIKRFMKNSDGTFFVNILRNSLNAATPMLKESSFTNLVEKPDYKRENSVVESHDSDGWDSPDEFPTSQKRAEATFFKKPPFFCKVENDQRVTISHVKDDVIYLKTKECFEKSREIDDVIENYAGKAKNVQRVEVDQLVLYEGEEGKFYRAVVVKVEDKRVEIETLDHGEWKRVALTALKNISEELSRAPITYFVGGKLAGFEQGLGDWQKKIIEEYAKKRKKFVVSLGFDDELDLYDGTQLLSEEFQNIKKEPRKVMLKDVEIYKPEVGTKPYFCGFYKSSNEVTFVASDALTTHMDLVTRSDVEDRVPYSPATGEVCLCYYLDHWYRCVVIRIFGKNCEVVLLDFGRVELINKEDLRKPDEKTTAIPALAIPCVLVGLPQHPNIENMLKDLILYGEFYNVEVKRISGGKCDVEVPAVYKKIRDSA